MSQPSRVNGPVPGSRWTRRAVLRGMGGVTLMLGLPILAACGAAPAAPTVVPPTAVPHPTDVLPTPVPTAAPAATQAVASATAVTATTPSESSLAVAQATAQAAVPTAAAGAQLPAATLTFTMWDNKPHVDTMTAILKEFKQVQPNLTVNIQQFTNAERETKYKLLATSGTPPDASIGCCGDVPTYGELGLLLNLDPYMSKDNIGREIYFAGSLSEGLYDPKTKYIGQGNLLALPVNFVFELFYYNKNLLDKAGLQPPNDNWTWDDLISYGQKLTIDKNGKHPTDSGFDPNNVVQWGLGSSQGWDTYDMIIEAGGREVTPENKVVIDTPETIKGIQFQQDLIQKYHVLAVPATNTNIPEFPSGTSYALDMDGSWNYTPWTGEIKDSFAWDVVPVPIGPVGKRIGYGGSNQIWSWNGVKHPDASWAVLKWAAGPEMTLKWWATQGIPSVKESALSPLFPKIAELGPKMADISAQAGSYIQSSDPTIRSTEWKPIVTAELALVWEGKESAADACKKLQAKVEAIMSRPS